ncbi:MAG: hypothetical protein LBS01_07185 [Prevotellaceae bacterium]|jgi:hypothetical protein|nr:hypothetical protein [Prevotellaceae bacterium]
MTKKKVLTIGTLIVIVSFVIFVYVRYFFVFGEGVKAGEMNYFVLKGYVFKTYEGRLIQTGYKSTGGAAIQSNEFKFSVTDSAVADSLMLSSGKNVELHYKEYIAPLPWRGVSEFVVDKIVSVR